jgi:hypothetical protein
MEEREEGRCRDGDGDAGAAKRGGAEETWLE